MSAASYSRRRGDGAVDAFAAWASHCGGGYTAVIVLGSSSGEGGAQ
jgi:hypothetical protein